MRRIRLTVLFLTIFLALSPVAGARRQVISINPMGFLVGVTNASYEAAIFGVASFQLEGVLMVWDLGQEELRGWSANASVRIYPERTAPAGFFVGPGVGTGFGNDPEKIPVVRLISGYQWVEEGGFAASMSASLNVSLGETDGLPIRPGLGVNVGYAF